MRQLVSDRHRWVVAFVVLLGLVTFLLVRRTGTQPLAPGEVRVTGTVVNRIEGSRFCATRTVYVTFALRDSVHQGSTRVFACARDWSEGQHVALVVRARDGQIVRPERAMDGSFAGQIAIATAALLGAAALAHRSWGKRKATQVSN